MALLEVVIQGTLPITIFENGIERTNKIIEFKESKKH